MTYPPQLPGPRPPRPGWQQPPRRSGSQTFLGMSGGVLMLALAALVLIPVLCTLACCFGGGLAAIMPTSSTSPTP